MISQLAVARDQYLEGRGKHLWTDYWTSVPRFMRRNRIERAWLDGVTYAVVASVDNRTKVPAPGWMKGKP